MKLLPYVQCKSVSGGGSLDFSGGNLKINLSPGEYFTYSSNNYQINLSKEISLSGATIFEPYQRINFANLYHAPTIGDVTVTGSENSNYSSYTISKA